MDPKYISLVPQKNQEMEMFVKGPLSQQQAPGRHMFLSKFCVGSKCPAI